MASSPNPYATPEAETFPGSEAVKDVVLTQLSQNGMCLLGAVLGATAAFVGVACLTTMYIVQLGYLLLQGSFSGIDWGDFVFVLLMVFIGSLGSTFLFAGIGMVAYYPHRFVLRWTGGLNAKARG